MNSGSNIAYIAFEGDRCIASGGLRAVISAAKETLDVYRYAVRHTARATTFDPAFIPGPQ